MARFEREQSEYIEKLVYLNRVSKTVKGGRVMKFSALMVVGDGKGKVGYGLGKAAEVPEAIRKGLESAKKNMITVTMSGSTIPHETIGEAGAGRVLMKPAAPGTGIIAGGAVRAVMEAAGIKDIRAKSLRSNNPNNVVSATMEGLLSLRNAEQVAVYRQDILCLFVARFNKLAYFRVDLACNVLGVILALRVIPAEEYLLIFAAVEYRAELFGEAVAGDHVPCHLRCSFDIV